MIALLNCPTLGKYDLLYTALDLYVTLGLGRLRSSDSLRA